MSALAPVWLLGRPKPGLITCIVTEWSVDMHDRQTTAAQLVAPPAALLSFSGKYPSGRATDKQFAHFHPNRVLTHWYVELPALLGCPRKWEKTCTPTLFFSLLAASTGVTLLKFHPSISKSIFMYATFVMWGYLNMCDYNDHLSQSSLGLVT